MCLVILVPKELCKLILVMLLSVVHYQCSILSLQHQKKHSEMKQFGRYVYIGMAAITILSVTALLITIKSKRSIEKKWCDAMENVKAYDGQLSNSKEEGRVFKLTVEQLRCANDSIIKELERTRKELSVNDSRVKALQYVSSEFTKTDTIVMRDTIFNGKEIAVDTVLSDRWYSVKVGLRYPSSVVITPKFKSEKNIVVSSKRETVNPPRKFFLFRWFQKRHTVLVVNVVEKNPYVQNQDNRFIEIVK